MTAWRVVEAQHHVSTRKLVSSAEEQELLEELLERSKPPAVAPAQLHYLLTTPFRYPPLRHGSRFGSRHETGVWYGAQQVKTALSEIAYYRFVFLEGTSANLGTLTTQLTAFSVAVRSSDAVDLTRPPFDQHRGEISSPTDYASSQALGTAMREAGVECCFYTSARSADAGTNIAVFSPAVFRRARPRAFETWQLVSTVTSVELSKRDYFERVLYEFPRAMFLVDGSLPSPAA
ncbi:MAG: RES family NAD+ phosphorylase [Phycisphaerae bacterium]|nr:RES family NAD+ phosphorylase [Gemmatimonadaceae bacterium]